ncbi:MAG: AAA family ATPase [Acholeplasmatales bacterium]|nr:AAA family ATPase [Acholeplasmatales bacterium]
MKKLVKIRLINWHYLSNETIEIKGNTLLTGPNASGKSTIMDAITFILTAGETSFNLAANEKGKRDLKGYVKCKLGQDDKEYLRNGDVSGHIALEFHDEKTGRNFTVGAVIDAFGDLQPAKPLFYRSEDPISDSMFISDDNTIYGTVEFRKHNPLFEYFLTKKEAKKGFRNAFGSINEDFYKLIPKALAFKPIADVKEFIYQNILEEKEIDVSAIKDSIRAYKELEITLKQIQSKIADLKEIDIIYQEILKIEENKSYLEYLMRLFDVEKVKNDIQDAKKTILKEEALRETKEQAMRDIDSEKIVLQERARELYNLLSNNETFKASEYVDTQIIKTKDNIAQLEANEQAFLKRSTAYKDIANELKKLSNEKLYQDIASVNLSLINTQQVEETKVRLRDISGRLTALINKKNQTLGQVQSKVNEVVQEINEISASIRGLSQNKINYNPLLIAIRDEIQEGLRRVYNYDINVHILAELCEITDPKWADTVEVFLGNRRFMMIVEPRYYDQALQIFNRIKGKYSIYGIGLVNTKQISKFKTFEKKSIASIIECENEDARFYINYTAGNVIMVDDVTELENYQQAITVDYLIYRGYTVTNLNPNIQKPFMGKGAAAKMNEQMQKRAVEAKSKYTELNQQVEELNNEIDLLSSLNINPLIDDLNKALLLQKERVALEDLKKEAIRQKTATPSDIEDDYNKVQKTIQANEDKKVNISMEIGGINSRIEALNKLINDKNVELTELTGELRTLAGDNASIIERAKNEYQQIVSGVSFKTALAQYQERFRTEENSYQTLSESIVAKQYAYINKYNSTLSVGVSEMNRFLVELNKLEKSELISYEQKVRQARESAEVVFKEDFIAKLRNNILTAENEIGKINETLQNIRFGNDRYEFIFPRSSEYAQFYDMVTSDLVDMNQGLFTYDFQIKYDEQIRALFDSLSIDELNSNGAINKFTDYRTYMDYDIRIYNNDGSSMTYSKVFKEKSGGETQVPFYVAIIASFVRVYTKSGFQGGDPIGIVMFDEVFDKMDANRMRAMMNFILSMPLQVIIACPPQRMDILQEFAETTLIMVRQGTKATVLPAVKKKDVKDEDDE